MQRRDEAEILEWEVITCPFLRRAASLRPIDDSSFFGGDVVWDKDI